MPDDGGEPFVELHLKIVYFCMSAPIEGHAPFFKGVQWAVGGGFGQGGPECLCCNLLRTHVAIARQWQSFWPTTLFFFILLNL